MEHHEHPVCVAVFRVPGVQPETTQHRPLQETFSFRFGRSPNLDVYFIYLDNGLVQRSRDHTK